MQKNIIYKISIKIIYYDKNIYFHEKIIINIKCKFINYT